MCIWNEYLERLFGQDLLLLPSRCNIACIQQIVVMY